MSHSARSSMQAYYNDTMLSTDDVSAWKQRRTLGNSPEALIMASTCSVALLHMYLVLIRMLSMGIDYD